LTGDCGILGPQATPQFDLTDSFPQSGWHQETEVIDTAAAADEAGGLMLTKQLLVELDE